MMKIAAPLYKQYIKLLDAPVCAECVFYKSTNTRMGFCRKFGEKDVVSGKIIFTFAHNVREDVRLCGEKGRYFVPFVIGAPQSEFILTTQT
jgi:hypothetical protein